MSDPRFARLHTDPRFVRPKASKNKIVVDDRFKQLFQDQDQGRLEGKRKVDKYGRALEKESSVNDLKRYYRIDSPEADAIKRGQVKVEGEEQNGEDDDEDEDEDEGEPSSSSAPTTKSFMDLARGEVLLESSDEEEEEVIDDDDDEEGSESDSSSSAAGSVSLGPSSSRRRRRPPSRSPSIDLSETERPVFDDDEDESDEDEGAAEPTRRVAVVNMDWDNLRASDLYRVLASSLSATASTSSTSVVAPPPPKASGSSTKFDRDGNEVGPYKPSAKLSIAPGRLLNLRIYPSTFGRERMEREAVEGPPVEVLRTKGADSDEDEDGGHKLKGKGKEKRRRRAASNDVDDEEDEYTAQDLVNDQVHENEEDYDTEALRKYQLERLRYFYAIATFDTASAAKHVVSEINGTEFERTANVFDLQFVPDETSFDDDPVHEEATEASIAAEGTSYQGIDFSTDALRHSRVKLTWDADDPHRKTKLETYLAAALDKSKQKGATKGRPNVADADIAEYLASSSDEDDDARRADEAQEDEQDDFFEAAASDEPTKSKKEQKRDKLRSLFGLDDAGGEQSWDGGDKSTKGAKGGGMQITFAPALSERSAKQLDLVEGDKPETAIETYRRKEKERKERKKLERRAKAEGKDFDPYEGPFGRDQQGADGDEDKGFDDDFFADDGGKDPFSAYDDGNVSSGDEIGIAAQGKKQQKKKLSKKDKKAMREQDEERERAEQSELALLVGSDDEDDVLGGDGEGGKHFDMRKILKAEKAKGKKVKAKGKHQRKAVSDGAPVQDEFKLDLADDRFKSLHDDFDFAIDPSNPRYQKTRNMDALLAEGRKRRAKRGEARAPVSAAEVARKKANNANAAGGGDGGESLTKLIESVKRKAGETGGRGKRSKTE